MHVTEKCIHPRTILKMRALLSPKRLLTSDSTLLCVVATYMYNCLSIDDFFSKNRL